MIHNNELAMPRAVAAGTLELLDKEIFIQEGLLGFPEDRHFTFARFDPGDGTESPFFLLISRDRELSFPVIHPGSLFAEYRLPVLPELLASLQVASDAEILTFLIVTVRDRVEDTTVNLQGPLMISPGSMRGIQLVVEDYPLRYPLLKSAAGEL